MSDIPEHIMRQACLLANNQGVPSTEIAIAIALAAAEQRGREKAIERIEGIGREICKLALNRMAKALGDGIINTAVSMRKEVAIRTPEGQ